jgi:hypothetical protein
MRRFSAVPLFFITACARIVSPSGGPEDTIAPEVIEIIPPPGFVEEIPEEIIFIFSENIQGDELLIDLFPGTGGEVQIEGKRISVFTGSSDGVFMVTVPPEFEDRRGNKTGFALSYVWNSVPADSFAVLSASVLRDGGGIVTSGARCEFFLLPDSVEPVRSHFPDSLGNFTAGWLSEGDYRIICFEDDDRSRSWDPAREAGTSQDLMLAAGDSLYITMTMTITDSIGPVISEVKALDRWHLEIAWNEQVTVNIATPCSISITDPDGRQIEILGISAFSGRSTTGKLTVFTEEISDTMYSISIQGITDLAGNPSLPDSLDFWGTDSLPLTPFAVKSAYPADGSVDVPASGPFYISFTDWVSIDALETLYSVTRVADSIAVPGELVRTSPVAFSFTPFTELLGQRQYRADLSAGLISLQGDTLDAESWTFIPAWSSNPGFISGIISGTEANSVTVVVSPAGSAGETKKFDFAPGAYICSGIAGGRYTVSVFRDTNSDGIWNPGEPYGAWPGVVEVFPGIETENTNIQVVP